MIRIPIVLMKKNNFQFFFMFFDFIDRRTDLKKKLQKDFRQCFQLIS